MTSLNLHFIKAGPEAEFVRSTFDYTVLNLESKLELDNLREHIVNINSVDKSKIVCVFGGDSHVSEVLASVFKEECISLNMDMNISSNTDVKLKRCIHFININSAEKKEQVVNILVNQLGVSKNTVNIFSESSYFLVYRPLEQEDPETDYGWYILRGLSVQDSEDVLKCIEEDEIKNIVIDNEDYLVAKTNVEEQNSKTYYHSTDVYDVVLYPDEKKAMMFELIN